MTNFKILAVYFLLCISRKTQSVPPARKDTWLSVSFYCALFPVQCLFAPKAQKGITKGYNDRGGVWRMCILGLCRVYVRTYVRTCARTSAVNLRRYGDTPQTITIYDLIEISLLCAAHATVKFSGVKLCLP